MRIKVKVSIGLVRCTRETTVDVDDEDLEGLTERERNDLLDEAAEDAARGFMECSWEIVG